MDRRGHLEADVPKGVSNRKRVIGTVPAGIGTESHVQAMGLSF